MLLRGIWMGRIATNKFSIDIAYGEDFDRKRPSKLDRFHLEKI